MTEQDLVLGEHPNMPEAFSDDVNTSQESEVVEVVAPNQENVAPEDKEYIRIPRKELQTYIDKLRVDDPEFAQVYNRDIGNKAALRYKPEIESLRAQNKALQTAIQRAEYSALTPEQVNTRFKTDPQFAKDYAATVHSRPETVAPAFNPVELKTAFESAMGFANRVLSQEQVEKLTKNIADGKYDSDESGNQYNEFSWREGIDKLQQDIIRVSQTKNVTTPTPQPVTPKPSTEVANPDMSNGGGRGSQRQQFTIQQVNAMSWDEQIKRWPNDGDRERAIENGEILVPGLNG